MGRGRRAAAAYAELPAVARDGTVWIADSGSGFGADDGFLFRIAPDGGPASPIARAADFPTARPVGNG
jgi:hypothetical protein